MPRRPYAAGRLALLMGALVAGLGLRPASARAQAGPAAAVPLDLRVSYEAPAACPTGAEFLGALQAHLAVGGDGPVDARVRITGPHDGEFELKLALRVDGSLSESQARAESCAALMQLAALTASMARTPPHPASVAATPVSLDAESLPLETLAAPDTGRDTALDDSSAAAESSHETLRPFALAEVRAASGMLPGAALGQGIGVGITRGPWSLRLSGTWWLPAQLEFSGDGGSPIPLELEQQSIELAPCAGQTLSRLLRLEGCALLAAHRTQTSAGERAVWGALGGAALAVLRPWRGLRVEAAAQLLVALSAPSYAVQTLENIYQAETLQPGARLAIGWEFGSDTPPPEAPPRAPSPFTQARAGRAP